MNVTDAINSRYCCRLYKPDPVSKETVLKVLQTATRSPSWANTQPWEIYVAAGDALERLRQAYLANQKKGVPGNTDIARPQSWPPALQKRTEEMMAQRCIALGIVRDDKAARLELMLANYRFFGAPVVIYLCMDRTLGTWSIFDLGLLSQNIMLAAKEHGLDTSPAIMLVYHPELIRAELGIPDNLSIVFGIALGFSDREYKKDFRSQRRPLSENVHLKGF